ncbi:hypothetical protein ACTXT7_001522 [Hymenolepis weldensis]
MKTHRKVSHAKKWAPPHNLSEINKQQRVTYCISLRSREFQAHFLDQIITDSDEKWWTLYNDVRRKRLSWLSCGSKPIPQPRQFGTAPEQNSFELAESFNGTKAYLKKRGQNKEASFFLSPNWLTSTKKELKGLWEDVINKNGDYVEH